MGPARHTPAQERRARRSILMSSSALSKDRRRIRRMFAGIAHRYDLLNHLLSANTDRAWRRQTVRLLLPRRGERILDLCTGTADLALSIAGAIAAAEGPRGAGEPAAARVAS